MGYLRDVREETEGMSQALMTLVWEHSQHKGTELLVLLAIADNADSATCQAYPSNAYLAGKARLSKRSIQYAIRALIESGELEVSEPGGWNREGTGRANLYRIKAENLTAKGRKRGAVQSVRPLQRVAS